MFGNPAIVIVTYNRLVSFKRLLKSIQDANYNICDIPLIISIDRAPNFDEMYKAAFDFEWKYGEKKIITFKERQGLRKHVIKCGDLSNLYGSIIVLEDDLFVSPGFYNYVLQALEKYRNQKEITGISLYSHEWNGYGCIPFKPLSDNYDAYFGQFSISWGQCWTAKWWNDFKKWYIKHENSLKFNDKIPEPINFWSEKSWGKYYANYIVEENKYFVIPRISYSTNFGDCGEHAKNSNSDYQVSISTKIKTRYLFPTFEEGIKYDLFFENQNIPKFLEDLFGIRNVCIDLNSSRKIINGYDYLLSTQKLKLPIIREFGLNLRPIENNVFFLAGGNGIYLYKLKSELKIKKIKMTNSLARYYLRDFSKKGIFNYALFIIKKKIFNIK